MTQLPKEIGWPEWMGSQSDRRDEVGRFCRWWFKDHNGPGAFGVSRIKKAVEDTPYEAGFYRCRREFTAWHRGERLEGVVSERRPLAVASPVFWPRWVEVQARRQDRVGFFCQWMLDGNRWRLSLDETRLLFLSDLPMTRKRAFMQAKREFTAARRKVQS